MGGRKANPYWDITQYESILPQVSVKKIALDMDRRAIATTPIRIDKSANVCARFLPI